MRNQRGKKKEKMALIYSKREEEIMKEVFSLLVKNEGVIKEMETIIDVEESDELASSLINVAIGTGLTFQMIRTFVGEEFRKGAGLTEGSIMRGNTIASKLTKAYFNIVGRQYLIDVLGSIVYKLVITDHKVSLEIDPSKIEKEEAEKNVVLLKEKLREIVETLIDQKNVDKIPAEIRIIASYFAEFSKEHAPKQMWALVGGLLLLRYINPALTTPESFGLLPEGKVPSPIPRRNLVLISKAIQNLSNGVEFGKKEQFMMAINDFIRNYKDKMEKYFERVVTFTSKLTVNSVPDEKAITVEDLHFLHRIFTHNESKIVPLFKDKSEAQNFSKLLEKLGSYQSKISFSFLNANDKKAVMALLEQHNEEPAFIGWVDKKKRGKVQKRLLVVGHNRILSVKPGGKLAREGHLLDLKEIKSINPRELELVFKNFSIVCDTEETDGIIHCIRSSFHSNFSSMPKKLQFKVSVDPPNRVRDIVNDEESECGGFVGTYKSLCNYYNSPYNFDVCWHFTHLPSRVKVFDLKRFTKEYSEQPLTTTDLGPLFWSLRFNDYFESFFIKDYKLDKESFLDCAEMFKYNRKIQEIVLSNVSGTKEGFSALFESLTVNKLNVVNSVDISNNSVEDKGAVALGNFILTAQHNLVSLNIANTNIGKQGLAAIYNSMRDRVKVKGTSTISYLNISDNKLSQATDSLAQMITISGSRLKCLYLSNTGVTLQPVLEALKKSCPMIEVLDISKNKLKAPDVSALVNFLQSASSLTELNLAATKIPTEALNAVLTSVSKDTDLVLNISDNGFGVQAATIIASLSVKLTNIHTLDLSDNDLGDDGVSILVEGLCSNSTLKNLILDRTLKASKQRQALIENMVKLIQANSLEALSIKGDPKKAGSQLKHDIAPILYALGSNISITSLDISGNQMSNKGAIALAKALQQNHTLTSILFDGNQTRLLGFINLKNALEVNQTVKKMPIPVFDVGESMSSDPDKQKELQNVLISIERFLLRNQERELN